MQNHWGKSLNILLILVFSFSLIACTEVSQERSGQVRLVVVNTPYYSGLMDYLLKDFESETGISVSITNSEKPFKLARDGQADLVISHYGKSGLAEFVSEGYGSWPRMVFANQAVLIGPKNDPAGIHETSTLSNAFQRIASSNNTLLANKIYGIDELTRLSALTAGLTLKDKWYQDKGLSKGKAIKAAEKAQAYVLWGAIPFLKFKTKHGSDMDILLSSDPLLQRVMALSIVNSNMFPDVNHEGAEVLADYLLSIETQAKIIDFRVKGSDRQLWWPTARHN